MQGLPNQTNRMGNLFNWYAETANKLQDFTRASLHDPLQKVNKKLKTQEIFKAKDCKTDMTIPNSSLFSKVRACLARHD